MTRGKLRQVQLWSFQVSWFYIHLWKDSSYMWHCVGFACELPLKALRYPEPQLYSMSQCFPFLCKDYALWFDIMFNFLYLLLQIPSRFVWNTSLQVWRSMIWCKDREDRIRVYEEGWKPLEKETPRFQSSCKLPPKHPWSMIIATCIDCCLKNTIHCSLGFLLYFARVILKVDRVWNPTSI